MRSKIGVNKFVNKKSPVYARNEFQMQERDSGGGFHTILGKSRMMRDLINTVDRIARTDSSVLILGESGVGKELFAEQVHLRSMRSHAPFIRVNCAALPEGLLESELFGHIKGAYTGAVKNRRGRFESAQGGTIFLDEIGDISLSLQAKLLRVLQEKTFEKVGSDITISVDTRIITATNKDIEAMVEEGMFRSDLYYRLNVLPVYVPPLRQRTEDIIELAGYFLSKYSVSNKKNFKGFSESAIRAMLVNTWPGNVRELENCVERACVVAGGEWIQKEDLFHQRGGETENSDRNLKAALNVFKANFIRKVLEENEWNRTEAAKSLDIQRTYLSRLIKELKIYND